MFEIIPENKEIFESILKMNHKFKSYKKILCSISGGSDSDILLDLCHKLDDSNKITYVFFDTGLEYQATLEHLEYLENRYNIRIERAKAVKAIPTCCKEYGQPFLSKQVSEWISRLQRHNFQWEDRSFKELYADYPKCRAALRWWCNDFGKSAEGRESSFNIGYNQFLKEFMVANPPTFKISNKCCHFAKKMVASRYRKEGKFDLSVYGVRRSEGGARRSAYKTCFTEKESDYDEYRPIFWYLNESKEKYSEHFQIMHSRCYTEYGLKRTGCAGCPYGRDFEVELAAMERHEPLLYRAVCNIFCDSYEYTRAYRQFIYGMRER